MEFIESESVGDLVKVADWLIECMGGCGRSLEVEVEYPVLEHGCALVIDEDGDLRVVKVEVVGIFTEVWSN